MSTLPNSITRNFSNTVEETRPLSCSEKSASLETPFGWRWLEPFAPFLRRLSPSGLISRPDLKSKCELGMSVLLIFS